jgi:hypothetical protein
MITTNEWASASRPLLSLVEAYGKTICVVNFHARGKLTIQECLNLYCAKYLTLNDLHL